MLEAKFALVGVLVAILATVVGDVATGVVAAAAAFAGLGYIWKNVRRAAKTWDVIEALPSTLNRIESRLDELESGQRATHEPVEAIARELDVQHRHQPVAPHLNP
jgi:uncharacterized membrane protein YccC